MASYEKAIEEAAKLLIDNKDYLTLQQILKNYDYLVKKKNNLESFERPYWEHYCFFGKDKNEV